MACRFLAKRPEILSGRAVLEVDAGAGLVGLFAAYYARSMTITTGTELGSRLARFNGMLMGTGWASRLRWSGSARQRSLLVPGCAGPKPVYVYTMPLTQQGAEEFTRQWQWDSGTAMRALRPGLLAPRFEILVHAAMGGPSDGSCHERAHNFGKLASAFLLDGGLALAAAGQHEDSALEVLVAEAPTAGLAVELDEVLEDSAGEGARILVLRRVGQAAVTVT